MIEDINTVHKLLLERFPELWRRVEESFGSYYDLKKELPDAYPIFEDILNHVVTESLDTNGHEVFLAGIFRFLEEMANSSNPGIIDLLSIAMLEKLVASGDLLARAWPYMGKRTRELTIDTARHHGCLQNLPLGEGTPGNGH